MPVHVVAFGSGCLVGGLVASWLWSRVASGWKELAIEALDELEEHVGARAIRMARRVESLYRAHHESGERVISVEADSLLDAVDKLMERE